MQIELLLTNKVLIYDILIKVQFNYSLTIFRKNSLKYLK